MKLIIIDGKSGAGKTTYARSISDNIVHMDDFFLPIDLRTKERLDEVGGNIHYERFKEEVVDKILKGQDFSYRIFNCKEMDYVGERHISCEKDIVIEGAYSMHPYFNWDSLPIEKEVIFMDISDEEQEKRIRQRNGDLVWEIYRDKWIPMENRYFEK
ncbi:MAG: hypothetical protein MJ146_03535 [Clostridia bacterium]|nr:hypothetical protein [Clostridia bacterium]